MIFPPCEKPVRILNSCKFHPKNSGAGLRHLATGKVAIGSRGVSGVEVGSLLLANGGICCLGDIGEILLFLGICSLEYFILRPDNSRFLLEGGPRASKEHSRNEAGFVREAEIAVQGSLEVN